MAKQEVAPRAERDQAWAPILAKVMAHEGLSNEEKAAAVLLVVSESDALDGGETLADLRTALDRGLAGLHEKGQIERSQAGEYRLKRGEAPKRPMAVSAEPETKAEEASPSEEREAGQDLPEVAS